MPEQTLTTKLQFAQNDVSCEADARPTMIKVDHVNMTFNMASEKMNNLKEYAIALAKRKLFFESFTALDNISFEVKKGDVFGILGTNGSGKSTLLKIIAGVLDPTSGTVEVNGNIAPLIELGAGFDMELSARENIFLNGALLGYSKKFIEDHFDEIVSFAEVEKFLDMPMKNYSSGMVARIAFAIATVIVPEILIVDEVLSVGDFMFQKKCEDRINDLITKHGVTVLIVSHSNDQIERLCDKAVWIEKGHTRVIGNAEQICNAYRILGGRKGSAESEAYLFGKLNELPDSPIKRSVKVIGGESHYAISRNLIHKGWGTEIRHAVLVPDNAHTYSLIATGIAGALDAPVIPFNVDDMAMSLAQAIEGTNIERAYVLADDDTIERIADCGISTDSIESVMYIGCERSLEGRRRDIVDYGNRHGIWASDFAIVASFEDARTSFKYSPISYVEHAPMLVIYESENGLGQDTLEALKRAGIHRLFAVGGDVQKKLSEDDALAGFTILNIEDVFSAFGNAAESRRRDASIDDDAPLLVASGSDAHWPTLISVPSFVGKTGEPFTFFTDENMDSMASCYELISSMNPSRIDVVGNGTLSQIERKLAANA